MVDLLYDYHLAQSLAKGHGDSTDYCTRLYTDAVFRKYGITSKEFDHTMEWYIRNSEELFKIYKAVDEKFAKVTSISKTIGNPYATMKAEGDTMNLWEGRNFYLLTSSSNNRMTFSYDADSLVGAGDKLMWQFDTHWYYREGTKAARAMLAVIYDNDSVGVVSQSIYSTGKQDLTLFVGKRAVKSVQGFFYQESPWTKQPAIVTISDPVLVRFKKQAPKPVVSDSAVVEGKPDAAEKSNKDTLSTTVQKSEPNDTASTTPNKQIRRPRDIRARVPHAHQ